MCISLIICICFEQTNIKQTLTDKKSTVEAGLQQNNCLDQILITYIKEN